MQFAYRGAGTPVATNTVAKELLSLYYDQTTSDVWIAKGTTSSADWARLAAVAGNGTVTSIAVSGGTTGLTTSGGPITTSGTITIGGTLAVASGGTGTTSPSLVAGSNVSVTGTWPNQTISATSSGGTVTSVSSGNLSPLFTSSVATSTTTPAISYSLSTAAANTFFGNFTGSTAAPSFGTPTLASANFANQGTATTVLHGNAAGNPSWSAVSLTADVSGILPVANGGTGTSTPSLVGSGNISITGSWPNQTVTATGLGTGSVTSVSVTTANGVSGTVATATTTPAITLSLGAITPTSVNGLTITTSTGTLTVTNGKTASFSNSITFAGTDSTTMTFPPASASIGYINVPQNSQSAAYTTVLADSGKHILHPSADTTARTFTIDSNANVAYAIGTVLTFINQNGAGTVTIAITSDTMRLAGAGTTGSRTLAANGIATAIKLTSTEWIISGTGLT